MDDEPSELPRTTDDTGKDVYPHGCVSPADVNPQCGDAPAAAAVSGGVRFSIADDEDVSDETGSAIH